MNEYKKFPLPPWDKLLGQILVENSILTNDQLLEVVELQKKYNQILIWDLILGRFPELKWQMESCFIDEIIAPAIPLIIEKELSKKEKYSKTASILMSWLWVDLKNKLFGQIMKTKSECFSVESWGKDDFLKCEGKVIRVSNSQSLKKINWEILVSYYSEEFWINENIPIGFEYKIKWDFSIQITNQLIITSIKVIRALKNSFQENNKPILI